MEPEFPKGGIQMTRTEICARIQQNEQKGIFDCHIDPIPEELIIPVTEEYHYPNNRSALEKIKYFLEKFFIVKPFTVYQNRFVMKTRVFGREHLEKLGAAVLTCNHVAKFDCLAVQWAARGHRTFVVAAPFNNMKGFLGEMMRAGDMLPMSETIRGNHCFNQMVEEVLVRRNNFLLIYPEASMWWHYAKPRPFKSGAFHIAAKYAVPVVPQFITYRNSGKKDEEGLPVYYFDLHILQPITPDPKLSRKENAEKMAEKAYQACKMVYESVYRRPLSYTCGALLTKGGNR